MIKFLPLDWYLDTPIDYEYKQYIILSYLQTVDSYFIIKKLSPHLLHMESMIEDMLHFQDSLREMRFKFDKQRYHLLFHDNPKLVGEHNEMVEEIEEVVEFSLPLIKNRIDLGHTILRKNKQVLY